MKAYRIVPLLTVTALFGCDRSAPTDTTQTTSATVEGRSAHEPDDLDKAGAATPTEQGKSEADEATTGAIRQAILADDSLSTDAKGVTVLTNNGVIVLRGTVANEAEHDAMMGKARAASTLDRVDDQLDVTSR